MSAENNRVIPLWIWVVIAFASVGAAVWLASSGRRPDPPESFRYDVVEFEQVDPDHVIATELAPLAPGIPGLRAIAATPDGRILIAGDKTLLTCGLDGSEQTRRSLTATPVCLAAAPNGSVFLGMVDRIDVLDAAGSLDGSWPLPDERGHVTSIAADETSVYVADAGNRAVLRFDYDGQLVARIGEKDAARDIPGLIVPSPYFDIAFDNAGALWAVNPGRHGFEQYRATGELVSAWYRPSMKSDGFCGCCNPAHIAFRSDGTLVTVEKGLVRVKLYSVDQKLLGFVAGPDAFRSTPGGPFSAELDMPLLDVAVDANDRILLIDGRSNTVRVFKIEEPA
ncbi:MAG: hypothetical protein ACOX5J_00190 [Candidatus Hydrogenedentales bacterium]|jgi:DNA-binding beta-propeller fold protein YncE